MFLIQVQFPPSKTHKYLFHVVYHVVYIAKNTKPFEKKGSHEDTFKSERLRGTKTADLTNMRDLCLFSGS